MVQSHGWHAWSLAAQLLWQYSGAHSAHAGPASPGDVVLPPPYHELAPHPDRRRRRYGCAQDPSPNARSPSPNHPHSIVSNIQSLFFSPAFFSREIIFTQNKSTGSPVQQLLLEVGRSFCFQIETMHLRARIYWYVNFLSLSGLSNLELSI